MQSGKCIEVEKMSFRLDILRLFSCVLSKIVISQFSDMIVCYGMISFKTRNRVKCWLFWACFIVVASCMSCLSTADYTVAESGALVKEVQLSV